MNVWLVSYTTVFSSSSGMNPYTNPPEKHRRYVVSGDSVHYVKITLEKHHGQQTAVTVDEAHWLGIAVPDPGIFK